MGLGAHAITNHTEVDATASEEARALYLRWRPVVFDLLLRRVRNLEEAEGLCQEALWRALQRHKTGEVARFGPYAMRTALNLATDRGRRARFRGEEPDLEAALSTEDEHFAPEHSRLRAAVGELPDELRVVVELRYERELSFAEIAVELDLSKNAVFARHQRALAALRQRFDQRRP